MKDVQKENYKEAKIALTIPTGRPLVVDAVNSFLDNARSFGYDLKNFSVYLSIDTQYKSTFLDEFKRPFPLREEVSSINYISEKDRQNLADRLSRVFNLEKDLVNVGFAGRGYSKQRNSALFYALSDGNDYAICFDDDESPTVPFLQNNNLSWRQLDFFTPHIKELSKGIDVTRGPYLGYISPIPSDFEKDIPEEIRTKLGDVLQLGNDVISRHSFFDLFNKIKCLHESDSHRESFEVTEGEFGKHIYAGNMGLNLHSVRDGKIPLFYVPNNARGEDTLFALQLKNTSVKEVGSFIFHDPFGMYPDIFNGEFPAELKPIPVTADTTKRFADALNGWLGYAPLLIFMTSKDEEEKDRKITSMLEKIAEPTMQLANLLNYPDLTNSKDVLQSYVNSLGDHFTELRKLQEMWRGLIKQDLSGINLE